MIPRRIVPRDAARPVVAQAKPGQATCGRAIVLDGTRYRCRRSVRIDDHEHDGIHDAFCEHSDGGACRW